MIVTTEDRIKIMWDVIKAVAPVAFGRYVEHPQQVSEIGNEVFEFTLAITDRWARILETS